jgi:FHA domain
VPVTLTYLAMKYFVNPTDTNEPQVPALLWEAPPIDEASASDHWVRTDAGQLSRPRAGEPVVFFVAKGKSTNNPFAMGVTVGRIESNDVIIEDGSVSRFHAWFQRDERTQTWTLTDAESRNGTWVDGNKLKGRERVVLKDESLLRFGDVQMQFYLAETLKKFVESRYRGSKR